MDIWIVIGALGVVFTSLQLAPQVWKSLRTRQVRDLSLGLCIIVGCSAFTWTLYGIHIGDAAVITANVINFAGAAILFTLKIRGGHDSGG